MNTLAKSLKEEIERCQELLTAYDSLGPAGMFGKNAIKADIEAAHDAMLSGDVGEMVKAHEALKECE